MEELNIISRESILAQIQAQEVGEAISKEFPDIAINYLTKKTQGDLDTETSLDNMPDIGVFTSDIREELLSGKADLAVHSWKDLPIESSEGTEVLATLKRADLRDILYIKKTSLNVDKIKILTSSPRRKENLSNFLPKALPKKFKEIEFHDVRGNIPTRVKKLLNSDFDGLVIAKAAIDRLRNGDKKKFPEILDLEKDLENLSWMVIPLSENPCAPGQGALGIEVKSDNEKVRKICNEINDLVQFRNIELERDILSKYGGGCHQKIGASLEHIELGLVTYIKGETPDGVKINEKDFIHGDFIPKISFVNSSKYFPKTRKEINIFERRYLKDGLIRLSEIKNSGLYISRASAISDTSKIDSSNTVWTSGVVNWFKLAKRGIWVNGSSDGLGEIESPPVSYKNSLDWFLVSHKESEPLDKELIATYELVPKKIEINLAEVTHFFWMSSTSFFEAMDQFPSIKEANHACGLGKTFIQLNNYLPGKIEPFLNYEVWLEKIKETQ